MNAWGGRGERGEAHREEKLDGDCSGTVADAEATDGAPVICGAAVVAQTGEMERGGLQRERRRVRLPLKRARSGETLPRWEERTWAATVSPRARASDSSGRMEEVPTSGPRQSAAAERRRERQQLQHVLGRPSKEEKEERGNAGARAGSAG
jgi:hypothetical protein